MFCVYFIFAVGLKPQSLYEELHCQRQQFSIEALRIWALMHYDIYAPEQALQKSLEQLDIIEQIHKKMQGYDGTDFEGCSRKSVNPQTYVSGIAGYSMIYDANFVEET